MSPIWRVVIWLFCGVLQCVTVGTSTTGPTDNLFTDLHDNQTWGDAEGYNATLPAGHVAGTMVDPLPNTEAAVNDSADSVQSYTNTSTAILPHSETLTVTPESGIWSTAASTPPTAHVLTDQPITARDPSYPEYPHQRLLPSPVTSVTSLCVCDLLVAQCDVNCCCDPECTASDFSVFSECSVSVVQGDGQLCTQEAVFYSINSSKTPERVVQTVELTNPNIFCIQATNYPPALSFITPTVPTQSNFDNFLKEFGGIYFNAEPDASNTVASQTRYEYGSSIQTADESYLKIPAPLGTKVCTDSNPVGFLVNHDFTCSRNIQIENCSLPALTLGTYLNVSIWSEPSMKNLVNITVQSIFMKSLDGTLSPGIFSDNTPFWDSNQNICTDVVLGGSYLITYTDKGEITNITASFILGTINSAMVPLQQNFKINFIQAQVTGTTSLSGNPGYVFGLPLVAGFKLPQSGIIQSTDRFGQLTLLKSSTNQNCLTEEGNRVAVLFGYNMISGCTLQFTSNCALAADIVLNTIIGQQFPEYVATFGNSQPQNVADWVPITISSTQEPGTEDKCQIPVSFELEVKWTKYGSLVNPQAKIVNVSQKITHALIPNSGSENILQISTSVTFTDVSAPAEPGYKAQPTIDAKLPFDFFYPFV
ncbi:tectonic-1 [Bombina bombina]|uniref:tectonic-1 n=1 Tax=Bombina bombina TaxID=8345 RepID=UPI00235A652B|nr:tectonic-1 [Bombina bombina]